MKTNMGGTDRLIRFAVAIVAMLLIYYNVVSGALAYILIVLAGVFVLTSLVSFCPLYAVFGMDTCKVAKKD